MSRFALLLLAPFVCCLLALESKAQETGQYHVFIGTYTSGDSKGIYRATMDAKTGALSDAVLAAESANPSFLAIAPNLKSLYAVNELTKYKGQASGAVSSFSLDTKTGEIKELNQQSSRGGAPCHLVVDKSGRAVLVANYVGGSVASLPIQPDGSLGQIISHHQHAGSSANPRRQTSPHGHSINLDPANRFAVAADLGIDKLLVYRFEPEQQTLTAHAEASLDPGAGPRHFVFHPSGKFAYVINELHLTITVFQYDAKKGQLKSQQTISTLPASIKDRKGMSTAEVRVTPDGKFLYGSNRGHDTIAMFRIDPESGKLTSIGHQPTGGRTPRNFNLDPQGRFLLAANQNTHNVVVFRINPQSGKLEGTGRAIYVPNPVCVRFVAKP